MAPNGPRHRRWATAALVAFLIVTVAACNSSTPRPSGSTAPIGTGPVPQPTHWPSLTVDSTIALGVADPQFQQIGADLTAAVDANDLSRLLQVSANAETFLAGNQTNIPRLQDYDGTQAVGDRLAAAYAQLVAGIKQIHDSLASGDGAGVTAGFQTFAAGNTAYAAVRPDLLALAAAALDQKRKFNL